jgi:hypothetical protein
MKMNHSCLLGHYVPTLSSRYLEEGDKHLVSHLQFLSFDAAFHQHTAQSSTKCLIRLILLRFTTFDSLYFNVVESYTFFCFPTYNSYKSTYKSPDFVPSSFAHIPLLKCQKFCIVTISFLMQPFWNIQHVGKSFFK